MLFGWSERCGRSLILEFLKKYLGAITKGPYKKELRMRSQLGRSASMEDKIDARCEPLYDTYTTATGAFSTAAFRFFATPVSGTKDLSNTNLSTAAVLPSPQAMLVKGIRLESLTTNLADWLFLIKLMDNAYIRFFIGTKDYLVVPVSAVAGKVRLVSDGGDEDGTQSRALAKFGSCSEQGFQFADNRVCKIAASENFGVDLIFETGWSISVTAAIKIRCYLEGIRYLDVR